MEISSQLLSSAVQHDVAIEYCGYECRVLRKHPPRLAGLARELQRNYYASTSDLSQLGNQHLNVAPRREQSLQKLPDPPRRGVVGVRSPVISHARRRRFAAWPT